MGLVFRTLGRAPHPVVESAADLEGLLTLDDALWACTALSVATVHADPVLLGRLDADQDGRVRSDELRAAIRWLLGVVKDRSQIAEAAESLRIDAIDAGHPDGAALIEAARHVAGDSPTVSLAQVRAARAEAVAGGLAEAGRVPVALATDAPLRAFLEHIVEVMGPEPHASGAPAVSDARLVGFIEAAEAWVAWQARGAVIEGNPVHPMGEETGFAWDLLSELSPKVEQYFVLCDAVRLDAGAWPDATGVDLLDPVAVTAFLGRAPVARPRADGVLDLGGDANPAHRALLRRLVDELLAPLGLPTEQITRREWDQLRMRFTAHAAWVQSRPSVAFSRPLDEVRGHLADATLHAAARGLLARTEAGARAFAALEGLERLLLFQSGLLRVANSLASHRDLYDPQRRALFEAGTLILDGRRFGLAVKVPDAARSEKFAALGAMFVIYAMVGRKAGAWDYEVAVPVTMGERGNLTDGMWGLFVDRDGALLHAQVRKVLVQPISLREAILQPLWRLSDAVQGMVDKASAAQQSAVTDAATSKAQGAVDAAVSAPSSIAEQAKAKAAAPPPVAPAPTGPPPAAPPPAPPAAGQLAAMAAGGGIALAAVGSAFAYVSELFITGTNELANGLTALFTAVAAEAGGIPGVAALEPVVKAGALPVAFALVLAGFLAIPALTYLLPVTLSAWFKLRRRDLAALLEGSGWAVNRRLPLTPELAAEATVTPAAR